MTKKETAVNYANISPLMDILFATYVYSPTEPKEFEIQEKFPNSYVGQMIKPMLLNKVWNKITHHLKSK